MSLEAVERTERVTTGVETSEAIQRFFDESAIRSAQVGDEADQAHLKPNNDQDATQNQRLNVPATVALDVEPDKSRRPKHSGHDQ